MMIWQKNNNNSKSYNNNKSYINNNNSNSSNIYETCGQQLEVTTPSVWAVPRAPTAADDGDFDNYICDYGGGWWW